MKKIIFFCFLILLTFSTNNVYALNRFNKNSGNETTIKEHTQNSNYIIQNKSENVRCDGIGAFTDAYCLIRIVYEIYTTPNNDRIISVHLKNAQIIYSSMIEGPYLVDCEVLMKNDLFFLKLILNWKINDISQTGQYLFRLSAN